MTPGEKLNLSERRACDIVGVARRVVRYEPVRPDDGVLRQRLRELAGERRRSGYRRLDCLLTREGLAPNHKKLLRIYREEGLKMRRRGGRKRALGTRAPMTVPQGPNHAGASTSCRTPSPAAGACASWRWSTTSAGNVWRWWQTLRLSGNKTGSMCGRPLRCKSFRAAMSIGRVHPCVRPVRAAPHGCWP